MSGPTHEASPVDAASIQLRAAEWVMERYESHGWTDERQGGLDAWLAASPAHLLAYWRLKATWERTHRLVALRLPPIGAHRLPSRKNKSPVLFRTAITAATVVAAATGIWVFGRPPELKPLIYSTPVGGHESVTLSDGSSIELNTETTLRVRRESRFVELVKGEAYFQIKHDNRNPFVVVAAGHKVVDLGTKFVVRNEQRRLTVTLLDGSLRFESAGAITRRHSEVLTPGDVATAVGSSVSVTQEPKRALIDAVAWRTGMLVFHDVTLADAVVEFNRYNQEKLMIADASVAKIKIDGTFHASNVSGFIDMTVHVLDLHLRNRGDHIAIVR